MARPYRLQAENCLYHITSRGDDRKNIYISSYDYEKFLEYVKQAKEKYKFYLYAYVLMTNHYHLLIETTLPNLSRIMQYLNTSYTTYYNTKRRKCGHLFQGRYKSIVIDGDSYFLELTRYIHMNPVRAKLVDDPSKYQWSSFKGYLKKIGNGYIDKQQIAFYCTLEGKKYYDFVMRDFSEKDNLFKDVYAGFILGKAEFIKERLKDLKIQVEANEISHYKTIKNKADIETIVEAVANRYKRKAQELYDAKKKPLLAKKMALYLSKRLTGLTNREIGERFKLGHSAVSKAAMDIERIMLEDKVVRKDIQGLISHFEV